MATKYKPVDHDIEVKDTTVYGTRDNDIFHIKPTTSDYVEIVPGNQATDSLHFDMELDYVSPSHAKGTKDLLITYGYTVGSEEDEKTLIIKNWFSSKKATAAKSSLKNIHYVWNGDTYNLSIIEDLLFTDLIKVNEKKHKVTGSNFADYVSLSGKDSSYTVNGGNGNDYIIGTDYDDTLNGGNGDDTIYGKNGDDVLTGGKGTNTYNYDADISANGNDTINLTKGETAKISYIGNLSKAGYKLDGKGNALIYFDNTDAESNYITLKDFAKKDLASEVKFISPDKVENLKDTYWYYAPTGDFNGTYLNEHIDAKGIINPKTDKKGKTVAYSFKTGSGDDIIESTNFADKITAGIGENVIKYTSLNQLDGDMIYLTKNENLTIDLTGISGNNATATYSLSGKNLVVTVSDGSPSPKSFTIADYGTKDVVGDYGEVILIDKNGAKDLKEDAFVVVDGTKGTFHNDVIKQDGYKIYKTVKIGNTKIKEIETDVTKKGLNIASAAGNDSVIGSNYSDTIKGAAGDDTISGGTGNDKLYGESGENTFVFKAGDGDDTVYGGDGVDTLEFSDISMSALQLSRGTAKNNKNDLIVKYSENDYVTVKDYYAVDSKTKLPTTSVKYITTTEGTFNIDSSKIITGEGEIDGDNNSNFILGSKIADTIRAYDGDDTIYSGAGNDVIYGGVGADSIIGDAGNDIINGGNDDDYIGGGEGADSINGGDGDDEIYGEADNDEIYGGDGDDYIDGGEGADSIDGGDDDDYIYGNAGADTINGGAGNDEIYGGDGADTIYGGADADYIDSGADADYIEGGAGNDIINGGDGADSIDGGDGDDYIVGGVGNDTINGEAGADTIYGGTGDDLINAGGNYNTISFASGNGSDTIVSGGGNDTVVFEESTNMKFYRNLDNNDLVINYGTNDKITLKDYYKQGVDHSVDTIVNGDDTLSVSGAIDVSGIEIVGTNADANLIGGDGNDTLNGGAGNDSIVGNAGNDSINAGEGNDTIYSGTGNDTINGGLGTNVLYLDEGNKTIENGGGVDTLVFSNETDINNVKGYIAGNDMEIVDTVGTTILLKNYFTAGHSVTTLKVGDDTINISDLPIVITSDASEINGTDVNDSITATNNNGVLINGNAGNDTINGGAGADTINGGDGADTIYGGDGYDSIDGGAGNDTINGGIGNDTIYGGDGNDTIYGDSGRDTIYGGDGADYIYGGDGQDDNDDIYSGTGNDTIYGGGGYSINVMLLDSGDKTIESGAGGLYDILVFLNETSTSNLIGHISGNDLVVSDSTGTSARLKNYFTEGHRVELLQIQHKGGTQIGLGALPIEIISGASTINGTDLKDSITATNDNGVVINGYAGNDTINGGAGNDTIDAGENEDLIYSGAGDDIIDSGAGNDTIYSGDGADTIDAGTGGNLIYLGEGNKTIINGSGNDTLAFSNETSLNNLMALTSGNDLIINDSKGNLVTLPEFFSEGNSVTTLKVNDDTKSIEDFLSQIPNNVIIGTLGDDTINGGAEDDIIYCRSGNDTVNGGAGSNIIYLGKGNKTIINGGGNDTLVFNDKINLNNIETLISGDDLVINDSDGNSITLSEFFSGAHSVKNLKVGNAALAVEDLIFTITSDASTISGTNYRDIITATNENGATINGYAGNDTIYGGAGNDVINGGAGNDVIYGNAGDDSIIGDAGNDIIYGGAGNDSISGNDGNDILYGNDGDDTIDSGAGNDTVNGGLGTNLLYLGAGSKTIINGGGADTLVFSNETNINNITAVATGNNLVLSDTSGTSAILVDYLVESSHNVSIFKVGEVTKNINELVNRIDSDAATIYGTSFNDYITTTSEASHIDIYGGAGNDSIIGTGNYNHIEGGSGNDTIYGSYSPDNLYGGEGDDYISGGGSYDHLYGDGGNDEIHGGSSDDTIEGGPGNDTIYGYAGRDSIIGGEGDDYISGGNDKDIIDGGTGADYIEGGAGNDDVEGGSGNDTIYGGDGDDTIKGSDGNDILYGGAGNDKYIQKANNLADYDEIYDEAGANDNLEINYNKDNIILRFDVKVDAYGGIIPEYSKNMYITNTSDFGNAEKGVKVTEQFVDGHSIESIKTADNFALTTTEINSLRSAIATWLYQNEFESVQDVLDSQDQTAITNLTAEFKKADWQQLNI